MTHTQDISLTVAAHLDSFLVGGVSLPYAEFEYRDDPVDEWLVYDIISDPDSCYYSGNRTATTFRVQFTLYEKSDGTRLCTVPEALETYLIGLGYRAQGNRRRGYDTVTESSYWQKDYFYRERRNIST
jgi:hypothetical protein